MLAYEKAKVISDMLLRSDKKRSRISDYAIVEYSGEGEDEEETQMSEAKSAGLRVYFSSMDVVGLTWSVAGCFEVEWKPGPESSTVKVRYCHWAEACQYVKTFRNKAFEKLEEYPEANVLAWVKLVERKILAKAVQKARSGEGVFRTPWGKALCWAVKEYASVFQDYDSVLKTKHSSSSEGRMGTMVVKM